MDIIIVLCEAGKVKQEGEMMSLREVRPDKQTTVHPQPDRSQTLEEKVPGKPVKSVELHCC